MRGSAKNVKGKELSAELETKFRNDVNSKEMDEELLKREADPLAAESDSENAKRISNYSACVTVPEGETSEQPENGIERRLIEVRMRPDETECRRKLILGALS